MNYNMEHLINGCKELGIFLTDTQIRQFIKFYEYLIEKNKVMNLTAITDFDEVVSKHFIDSISCVKALDLSKIHTIIDIGTGAGFPGIPVKIIYPDKKMLLLDSLNKRVTFLNEVIDLLELEKIQTLHSRAEDAAQNPDYRERFDLVLSRAVSNLSVLSEYCLPFVKPSGFFVSYKSNSIDQEISNAENALKILGGKIVNQIAFTLPETDINRILVCIKKTKPTPKKYPRKAGTASKEPL